MITRIMLILMLVLSLSTTDAMAVLNFNNGPFQPKDPKLLPTPVETVPFPPYGVSIVRRTPTSLSLVWSDTSSVEDGYRVELKVPGGDGWVVVDSLGPQTGLHEPDPYAVTGLMSDTYYCLRAVPHNKHGDAKLVPEACAYTDRQTPLGTTLVKRLRLLTHNVYGFDDGGFLVNHCEERAKAFGEAVASAVPAYDIVALQEYYDTFDFETKTCDAGPLYNAITSTGRYLNKDNSVLHKPNGETWSWGPEVDGGLGFFTLYSIEHSEDHEWSNSYWFGNSPVQGFLFTRVRIPNSEITLDIYVVHLYSQKADGCDPECKRSAVQQLSNKISEQSRFTGNPVLVMGDFNIPGPPRHNDPLYQDLINALWNPRDLWRENHPDAPGYTSDHCPLSQCADKTRIDYILIPTNSLLTNNRYEIFIRNRDDIRLVKWGTGFGSVSDHYGVEATIEIRKRVNSLSMPSANFGTTVR